MYIKGAFRYAAGHDPELNSWQDLGVKPNILLFCLMFARSASALLLRLSGARRSMYCELHEGKRFNSLDTSYLLLHTRLPGEDPPWPSCHGSTGGILTIMWVAGAWRGRALLWGLCAGACIYNVFCCAEITQSCLLSIQNQAQHKIRNFQYTGNFPEPRTDSTIGAVTGYYWLTPGVTSWLWHVRELLQVREKPGGAAWPRFPGWWVIWS